MNYSINLIISIVSLFICYQDFKDRLVNVYLYIILFLLVLLTKCYLEPINWYDVLFNWIYYLISFGAIFGYVVFIKKTSFFDYMGLGDVFISLIWVFAFRFDHMIVFNLVSLLCMLLYGLLLLRKKKTVPFAGIQALLFSMYIWFY